MPECGPEHMVWQHYCQQETRTKPAGWLLEVGSCCSVGMLLFLLKASLRGGTARFGCALREPTLQNGLRLQVFLQLYVPSQRHQCVEIAAL